MHNENIKRAIAYLHRYSYRRQDDAKVAHVAGNTAEENRANFNIGEMIEVIDYLLTLLK